MNKFGVIFKYELMRQFKNKVFITITALFLVGSIIGGLFVGNSINGMFEVDDEVVEVDKTKIYVNTTDEYQDYIRQLEATGQFELEFIDTLDNLKAKVEETGEVGLMVEDYGSVTKVLSGTSLMKDFSLLDGTLTQMYQNKLLSDDGLTPDQIVAYQSSRLEMDMINLGADGVIGYMYTYAYTFLLYMAVAIFGGIVSSSVVTEKTSKAMELLITSADSKSLITGKVFAVGLTCVLQLVVAIVGFVGTLFMMVKDTSAMEMLKSFGALRVDLLVLALFLFIVGFFSILFLYAGLSSFATKPEDANTVVTPLMLIIMVVFMLNLTSMGSGLFTSPIIKVLSYVPILSPFLLFSRYAVYGLSNFEIILGIITNILGAIFLIWMAAKIYRAGTLHYGNSVKFSKIFKSLRSAD